MRFRLPISARSRRLTIKPDAQAAIDWILLSTRKRWGADQRRRYRARLTHALNGLRDHPELGPTRNDLFPGCRNLSVDEHVDFYTITEEAIIVVRVLHGSQDARGKVAP